MSVADLLAQGASEAQLSSETAAGSRAQAAVSPTGVQHKNFGVDSDFEHLYGKNERSVDLFKQNIRFQARCAGKTYDLSKVVTGATWGEEFSNAVLAASTMPIQFPLTGTLTLSKPSLLQYASLMPPFLSANVDATNHTDQFGALGVVIIASVGYGGSWVPVWAMRVAPGQNGAAEEVDLSDGSWTLQLADDLYTVGLSQQDWKFTKGKTTRKQGWRAHEIAMSVCQQDSVPVSQLARGTAWMELSPSDTTGLSPIGVINLAYQQEMKRTGKTFVIRWSAPTNKYPLGALEVVPMRRNPNLLTFRSQLTEAILTRSQNADIATVIEARGRLRKATKGKSTALVCTVKSEPAIRRFGWIQKIVDFGTVSSMLELQIIAKRSLAYRLTPLRSAELTHPGIATIRAGDAIRIDLPEEGYAPIALAIDGSPAIPPKTGRTKYSATALQQAQQDDPSYFGLPDPTALNPTTTGSSNTSSQTDALFTDVAPVLPVADQGIAFVSSVQHTLNMGSYTIDLQTAFTDLLDPKSVQEQVDQALRAAKGKTGKGAQALTSSQVAQLGKHTPVGSPQTVGATVFTDAQGYKGDNLDSTDNTWAELSPGGTGVDGALGFLPYMTPLLVTYNGKSQILYKRDIGKGGGPIDGQPRDVDIHIPNGLGITDSVVVTIQRLR